MNNRSLNRALLVTSCLSVALGFFWDFIWAVGGLTALLPSLWWVLKDIHKESAGSDLLAVFSLLGTLFTHEFFAAAVIALMLGSGRVLEGWAAGQAERQLKSLLSRVPTFVKVIDEDGTISEVAIADVEIGKRILIRSGEITPTDGDLITEAVLDESALTGEPLPVMRHEGSPVSSGVLNAGSPFQYLSTSTAELSTYAGIVKLVRQAQAKSAPSVRMASKWAWRFVPVALFMAGMAWALSGEIDRAVAVLVAATPCPLILAVPISVVAGLSRAAKSGVIIKGGAILEKLAETKVVLIDKTGTLTHGGPAITQIACKPGCSPKEILTFAASLDQYSPHIVAKALVQEALADKSVLLKVSDVVEEPGHHISGTMKGDAITVGQLGASRPDWLSFTHPLMVAVTKNNEIIGVIGLKDPIRSESREMVEQLRKSGVSRIALVTGDSEASAQEVAEQVGISEVYSRVSAEGKLELTGKARSETDGVVVVVGDGINDAPALAAADVGVAMGARGASAASEAADVVIVEDSISRLTYAILIAKNSRRKALQAAGVGMSLSLIAMLAGAFGIASASEGALIQEAIDMVAIFWALTALNFRIS